MFVSVFAAVPLFSLIFLSVNDVHRLITAQVNSSTSLSLSREAGKVSKMTVRVGFRQTANIPHSFLKASNHTAFVLQKVTEVLNTSMHYYFSFH